MYSYVFLKGTHKQMTNASKTASLRFWYIPVEWRTYCRLRTLRTACISSHNIPFANFRFWSANNREGLTRIVHLTSCAWCISPLSVTSDVTMANRLLRSSDNTEWDHYTSFVFFYYYLRAEYTCARLAADVISHITITTSYQSFVSRILRQPDANGPKHNYLNTTWEHGKHILLSVFFPWIWDLKKYPQLTPQYHAWPSAARDIMVLCVDKCPYPSTNRGSLMISKYGWSCKYHAHVSFEFIQVLCAPCWHNIDTSIDKCALFNVIPFSICVCNRGMWARDNESVVNGSMHVA